LHRQAAATNSEPTDSVLAVGDTVAGVQSVVAILAALYERERSGRGQLIDMAMHDALLAIQEAANFYLFPDQGSDTDFLCAWVYRCQDEHVVIPHDPRAYWKELTGAMGRPDLLTDPRYDTYEKRTRCLDELEAHVQAWVAEFDCADDVVAALDARGLPGARLMRLGEALDWEQTRARNMTPEVDDRSGRLTRVLNTPYRFSRSQAGVRGVPAFRGEHNREVLSELLGLTAEEIDDLERQGVLSSRIPSQPAEDR
ncbi:MAG: CoA transferase, partial [Deltaproteobacteria bacterium]